jgi:hypothetical protein
MKHDAVISICFKSVNQLINWSINLALHIESCITKYLYILSDIDNKNQQGISHFKQLDEKSDEQDKIDETQEVPFHYLIYVLKQNPFKMTTFDCKISFSAYIFTKHLIQWKTFNYPCHF